MVLVEIHLGGLSEVCLAEGWTVAIFPPLEPRYLCLHLLC
jgi:hypothetical protein